MTKPLDWDDLRYFLEVARTGKVALAAERLGVEPTTVSRRLDRLEQRLNTSLMDRRRSGYVLTEAGAMLLPHAESIESEMNGALADAFTGSQGVSGKVRLGTPEAFGVCVVAPRLHELSDRHPDLHVELMAQPQFPSLVTREVDLSVTMDPPTAGRYIVSRLADINYYLFGSPEYLSKRKKIASRKDLSGHDFVDYVNDSSISPSLHYLGELTEKPRYRFTSTSILAQRAAAVSGYGLVLLPPYCIDQYTNLTEAWPKRAQVVRTLVVAVPSDLFQLRRIRVVWDFIRDIAEREPELFKYL